MEHKPATTSLGNDSGEFLVPDLELRKRKEYPKEEIPLVDVEGLGYKRRRVDVHRARTWPPSAPSVGAVVKSRKGGVCPVKPPVWGSKILSSDFTSLGRPRVSLTPGEGQRAKIGRNYCFEPFDDSSVGTIYGSGLGLTSTVINSSSEDGGESRLVPSSWQKPKVASNTNAVNVRSSSKTICTGSIGRHTGKHQRGAIRMGSHSHSHREKRRSRVPDHGDGEVLSPLSKSLTTLTAREIELDKSFGSRVRDISDGDMSGKTETACVVNSGHSSFEAGKRESARGITDYSLLKLQYGDSSEPGRSDGSRELQGSSVVTDLCVSSGSGSIFAGLRTSYKRYQSNEPSRTRELVKVPSGRKSVASDVMLITDGRSIADKYMSRVSEAMPQSSHAVVVPAESTRASERQQETCSRAMENESSSDDTHPQLDGSSEKDAAPTFVLSSGRPSKEQKKKLGVRPTTIDDDFDQYFAQLML